MSIRYQALRVFAAFLLCPLLQYCTQDIPTPIPAPKNTTQESLLRDNLVVSAAKEGLVAKPETIKVATQKAPKRPTNVTTSRLAECYDYYAVYYTNGVETDRVFLYTDCGSTGDVGSGGGSTGGGSDGGGSTGGGGDGTNPTSTISPNTVLVIPPDKPVNNIRQYLKCFTASQSATFTVYARQPRSGRPDTWAGFPPNVGHTFISITQGGITRVLGFYPTSNVAPIQDAAGIIGDNSQASYSISITTTISPANLNSLLTYIYSHSGDTYSLSDYNCTDFGIGAAAAAGLNLPDTYGTWGGVSGGNNPGNLGQDMRTVPLPAGATRTLSGTAPANAGGC
ncbi:MAG: hypothetical protein ACRYFR_12495 [Janthinobacterium lividum]